MSYFTYDCIDCGTENCPCYLALTGDCLTCSRLQGKECCDCQWKGVCVYNEFIQGGKQVNNPRKDFSADIVERKFYLDDLVVFVLDVGKGFALKASQPGSYVFVREQGSSQFYDTPISVMHADPEKGHIHLALKVISLKTKTLLLEKETFIVRGVYRNGIQGVEAMKPQHTKGKKILFIGKGVGAAPALLATDSLHHNNEIHMIIDKEKITAEMVEDYLQDGAARLEYRSLIEPETQRHIKDLLKTGRFDVVAVLASDYFIQTLSDLAAEVSPETQVATSNNFRICCGEGICGACSFVNTQGETIKMCKCQRSLDD